MLKEVDRSPFACSPQSIYYQERHSVSDAPGAFAMWSISSTADVQGRALCPGSTPGVPLHISTHKNLTINTCYMYKKFVDTCNTC